MNGEPGWAGVAALLGGAPCDPDTPLVTVDDLGLTRGDGVFETMLVNRGNPVGFTAHLQRMRRSAALMELALPGEQHWRETAEKALTQVPTGLTQLTLRLVCTRGTDSGGPTTFVRIQPIAPKVLAQRRLGVSAIALDRGLAPAEGHERAPWLLGSAKTLSYAIAMAALRHAARVGHDDVIFTTPHGRLLEAPTASVVAVGPGPRMRTPPASGAILPGTTQQALLRAAADAGWNTSSEELTVADLHAADAVWLVSSARVATAVRQLDTHPLNRSVPVELAYQLLNLPY